LLSTYCLSIADVSDESGTGIGESIVRSGRNSQPWRELLLHVIASVNFSRLVIRRGSNGAFEYTILGREYCVKSTEVLFDYLEAVVMRLGQKYPGSAQKKARFRLGIAVALDSRLREQHEVLVHGHETTALVLRDSPIIDNMLASRGVKTRQVRMGRLDTHAFSDGYKAGREVSLAHQVSGSHAVGSIVGGNS